MFAAKPLHLLLTPQLEPTTYGPQCIRLSPTMNWSECNAALVFVRFYVEREAPHKDIIPSRHPYLQIVCKSFLICTVCQAFRNASKLKA